MGNIFARLSFHRSRPVCLLAALGVFALAALLLPHMATASRTQNPAAAAEAHWRASFFPPNVTTCHWHQTMTWSPADDPTQTHSDSEDGWYKAPNRFRRTESTPRNPDYMTYLDVDTNGLISYQSDQYLSSGDHRSTIGSMQSLLPLRHPWRGIQLCPVDREQNQHRRLPWLRLPGRRILVRQGHQ